jgi:hypothetical protein
VPALTCTRPIALKGVSDGNSPTGEILELKVETACGTRLASKCPPCSETYKGRAQIIIGAGLPEPGELARAAFVTLTAPSFGPVHRFGPCICTRTHAANEVGIIGAPLNPARYDYAGAVAWHDALPALWAVTRRRIRVALMALPGAEIVVLLRAVEYQKRLTAHLHCIVIVRGVITPAGTVAELIRRALDLDSADHRAQTRGGFHWGTEAEIVPLYPERKSGHNSYARVAAYLGKYLTKDAQGETEERVHGPKWRTPAARHRAASRAAARAHADAQPEPVKWIREPGKLNPIAAPNRNHEAARERKIMANGYGGHFLSKSPGWGAPHPERGTFKALKAAAQAESIKKNGAPSIVYAWQYDAVGTREARERILFLATANGPPT